MEEARDNNANEEFLDYEDDDEKAPDSAATKVAGEPMKKGYVGINSSGFRDFLLKPELLRPIVDFGFEHPYEDDPLDFWCEDDAPEDAFGHSSALNREWNLRREKFHTDGYREGIAKGKKDSAQEGFNVGFKQSVHVGYNWGLVRGISSAFANLPDQLKEKLAGKLENKDKLQNLHDSVQSISTTDALKMYHNSLQCTEARKNHSAANSQTEDSSSSQLDRLYNELDSLLYSSQEINFTMKLG